MYKTSNDRRFRKNKQAIQRAYIDLVVEKGYQKITVTDVAERADINRMTFYAHYEAVEDIFTEFVDDMETYIQNAIADEEEFELEKFFDIMNTLMFKEEKFFRYVAKEGNCSDFREAFRNAIRNLLHVKSEENDKLKSNIENDLTSTVIAYAYLDWLSGIYGDVELSDVLRNTSDYLREHIAFVEYKKERESNEETDR